jgi:type I restriction enzyme S subunit
MRLQSAGSTIFYIARESFEKMPVTIPSKDEMIKIGQHFNNLDRLITLHQREVFYTLKHIFYRCCDTLLSGGL